MANSLHSGTRSPAYQSASRSSSAWRSNAKVKLRALVAAGGSPADGTECPPKRKPRCSAALVSFNATLASGPRDLALRAPREDQERGLRVGVERQHVGVPRAQQRLHVRRPAVAEPHPDDLRRRAPQQTPLPEVIVLADDHEPTCGGQRPD